MHGTDHNGALLQDVCIALPGKRHVFIIGDWGGMGSPPVPADARGPTFGEKHRNFLANVDDKAQLLVAEMMRRRAPTSDPDYILNVGDNFYWAGVLVKCGNPAYAVGDPTNQWAQVFETIYSGQGLDGKPWLGVLGNHDYGGYLFTSGWDQTIGYTWLDNPPSTRRWMTPAQYWSVAVRYGDFSVDYFFLDSNLADADMPSGSNDLHNICSQQHNDAYSSCGPEGPVSVEDCPVWFTKLWDKQMEWFEDLLQKSTTTWQIVVTHFPPSWFFETWKELSLKYGIDIIITGHIHSQQLKHLEDGTEQTMVIISGGGGGITSEGIPDPHGQDDQYGFMDMTLTSNEIMVEAISHGGYLRRAQCQLPRPKQGEPAPGFPGIPSMCASVEKGPIPGLAKATLEETKFV